MYNFKIIVVYFCVFFNIGKCGKILVIFHSLSRSHHILGDAFSRGLVEKGHEITFVSPFPEKNPPYRHVILDNLISQEEHRRMYNMASNYFEYWLHGGLDVLELATVRTLEHPKFQNLLSENFDLIVLTEMFSDAHKALTSHFKAPLIIVGTTSSCSFISSRYGNPSPPSYIPYIFSTYPPKMTFYQRVINSALYAFAYVHYYYVHLPRQQKIAEKYIRGANVYEAIRNVSVVFINTHPSLNQAVPHVPKMIEIGGFHVKPPKKLPDDLQSYLDNSKKGVIYFSMGSNFKSENFGKEKLRAFLRVFSKLNVNVLWKLETDDLADLPSNVRLGKWFPQQDILEHKNVKLFITHGGGLSTVETVHHGVPILAIPTMVDQFQNALTALHGGFGKMLPLSEFSEEELEKLLKELLENPKYLENAKMRSSAFRDRERPPMETAAFWVDYVLRHKNVKHLSVEGENLALYQYLLLDVFAFVLVILLTIILLIRTCFRKLNLRKLKKE